MSYQAKHKASGRYGVVDASGDWLNDFLGSKEEAQAKAAKLNSSSSKQEIATRARAPFVSKSSKAKAFKGFTLTKDGWLQQ